MEEIIVCDGIPRQIIYDGTLKPSDLLDLGNPKPKYVICVIPGNPGVGAWYFEFAKHLQNKTNLPVWIISYAGYTKGLNIPDVENNREKYDGEGQVLQKIEFFKKYLKGVSVIVVAHSFGAYFTLRLLHDEECAKIICRSYFLFPVFERFSELRGAMQYSPVIDTLSQYGKLLIQTLELFPFLSPIIGWAVYYASGCRGAVREFFKWSDRNVIRSIGLIFKFGEANVKSQEIPTVRRFANKLRFYYGSDDDWGPAEFYNALVNAVPEVNAEVCTIGLPHGFIIGHNEKAGNLVSGWIENDIRSGVI